MRARLVSLVVRPTAPPLSVGLVIAASLIIGVTQANLVRHQADGGSILLASHDDRGVEEGDAGRQAVRL
jgi:hypothetical protein